MWVGNEARNDSKDREWVNLEMSRLWADYLLIHSNKRVVLFIYIEILNDALPQEVLEVFQTECQILNVRLCKHGTAALANDERAHQASTICGDEHAIDLPIVVN